MLNRVAVQNGMTQPRLQLKTTESDFGFQKPDVKVWDGKEKITSQEGFAWLQKDGWELIGHTVLVVGKTMDLAEAMGVDRKEQVHYARGALLHDLGKMRIAEDILMKAGPLSDDEWEQMRLHPIYGSDLIGEMNYLKASMDILLYHHEWWNGNGYPFRLSGEQIPLAARIFAVVDVWDALRSVRPYREPWKKDEIKRYLRKQAGKQFDPAVVEVALREVFL
ncbi:MAG: HD domain-containing protein [Chloroflexi bacterium]|nr:MAG: HD domain-containing protein [Chloroflexota bacterium]MBL1193932.1 HD domain-containing protein [Chloroflexota bacterium]NOH11226.1 HD domain-containing protein [Chloroflexota bacterium]